MRALTEFVDWLRLRPGVEVPDFDPLDGGVEAEVLFLFEKPGPMTASGGAKGGSGFISRNNDDPTADATFRFMLEAGIERRRTAIWNLVPWWNGTRAISYEEQQAGAIACKLLVNLLPKMRCIVLVGARAARMKGHFDDMKLPVIVSAHPSPLVRATLPERWSHIPAQWAEALVYLGR